MCWCIYQPDVYGWIILLTNDTIGYTPNTIQAVLKNLALGYSTIIVESQKCLRANIWMERLFCIIILYLDPKWPKYGLFKINRILFFLKLWFLGHTHCRVVVWHTLVSESHFTVQYVVYSQTDNDGASGAGGGNRFWYCTTAASSWLYCSVCTYILFSVSAQISC